MPYSEHSYPSKTGYQVPYMTKVAYPVATDSYNCYSQYPSQQYHAPSHHHPHHVYSSTTPSYN